MLIRNMRLILHENEILIAGTPKYKHILEYLLPDTFKPTYLSYTKVEKKPIHTLFPHHMTSRMAYDDRKKSEASET